LEVATTMRSRLSQRFSRSIWRPIIGMPRIGFITLPGSREEVIRACRIATIIRAP